jgi:beta-galactosidase
MARAAFGLKNGKKPVVSKRAGSTRREFLVGATAAAGLAAAPFIHGESHAMPSMIQQNQRAGNVQEISSRLDRTALQGKSSLFIGTQYYRPPNPRPEDWERDLRRIKETGLQVIRVWVYWAKVNPRPGVWVWKDYDQIFDLAEETGLRVLIQFMPEGAPYWFGNKYPHTLYVGKDGRPVELSAQPALQIGGFPGVSVEVPEARAAVEEFLHRVAERYRQRSGLYGYDAWNETWLPEDYSDATQARFQNWLRTKYKDISALNQKYGRSYVDFPEIRIPKAGVYGDMFDYWEFIQWVKNSHLQWLAQTIQATDPNHLVVAHAGGVYDWDTDIWSLATTVDKWGTSCYVGASHASLTSEDIHETALTFNAIRDSAQGKKWWVAEMIGGSYQSGLGEGRASEAEILLRMILGISFGAEGLLFWQWRPEIYGPESPNYGLTCLNGALNSRTERVRQVCQMVAKHREVFESLRWSRPDVGLVWDTRCAMFEHEIPSSDRTGWRNFVGFYRALLDQGFRVEILNARLLAETGIPQGIKVVFAPSLFFDHVHLSENLKLWVERGGTLVGGPRYTLYDPDTYANKRVPPDSMSRVFGAYMEDTFYPADPSIQIKGDCSLAGLPGSVKGHLLVETYQVEGASVLGTWEGKPSLTTKKFGQGGGVMCGSFLGINYSHDQAPQLAKLVSAICNAGGALPGAQVNEGVIVRLAHARNDQVVFLINPFDIRKQVQVILPESVIGRVIDLSMKRESNDVLNGSLLSVTLKPKEAKVLLCKAKNSA